MNEASSVTDDYSAWKGWAPESFGRCSGAQARYFAWHVRRAMADQSGALAVLELGFGNGSFLGWCRDQGHAATGVETNARLVECARAAGMAAHGDLAEIDLARRFDLIAAFDVLEHVEAAALPRLLDSLVQRLAPGGALLFRFPNGESPWGLHIQHGDMTHIVPLGVSRMRQLATGCGLVLAHSGEQLPWRALKPGRWPGAWLSAGVRKALEWVLRKIYGFSRGLDLSPNQLVVLRRR